MPDFYRLGILSGVFWSLLTTVRRRISRKMNAPLFRKGEIRWDRQILCGTPSDQAQLREVYRKGVWEREATECMKRAVGKS
jgi:hypothetical protein